MAGSNSRIAEVQRSAVLSPEVAEIIATGASAKRSQGSTRAVWALCATAFLLLWLSFTPVDFGAAGWLALIPVSVLMRCRELPRRSYRIITFSAFIWAVLTLQWMRLGHPAMILGLLALAFYLSLYFPLLVFLVRRIRCSGIPLWISLPVVWTALEFVRAYVMTGFSWYYLGHSQYQWSSLIQISDITGAYGVSFLVAMASGALAEFVPPIRLVKWDLVESADRVCVCSERQKRIGVTVTALLIGVCVVYGTARMSDSVSADGPVVALVQGNMTPEVKHDSNQAGKIIQEYDVLSRHAASLRPDLIVWPETMFPRADLLVSEDVSDEEFLRMLPAPPEDSMQAQQAVEHWRDGYTRILLHNRSQEFNVPVLYGLTTYHATPDGIKTYNSAALVRPDYPNHGYVGRYDKIHRVMFGEYIPLESWFPSLVKLTPFEAGYGIDAGTDPMIFDLNGVRIAPIICFEDTVPQLVRKVMRAASAPANAPDVLVNMTNDGWFRGSSELDQHLITASFRCVETRRPMVRAVNTGISAFIDSNGVIREPDSMHVLTDRAIDGDFVEVNSMFDEETGQRRRQCSAVLLGQIPLDRRSSVYVRFGDWFPMLCVFTTVMLLVRSSFWQRLPVRPVGVADSSGNMQNDQQ